jgi:hypothetical protein
LFYVQNKRKPNVFSLIFHMLAQFLHIVERTIFMRCQMAQLFKDFQGQVSNPPIPPQRIPQSFADSVQYLQQPDDVLLQPLVDRALAGQMNREEPKELLSQNLPEKTRQLLNEKLWSHEQAGLSGLEVMARHLPTRLYDEFRTMDAFNEMLNATPQQTALYDKVRPGGEWEPKDEQGYRRMGYTGASTGLSLPALLQLEGIIQLNKDLPNYWKTKAANQANGVGVLGDWSYDASTGYANPQALKAIEAGYQMWEEEQKWRKSRPQPVWDEEVEKTVQPLYTVQGAGGLFSSQERAQAELNPWNPQGKIIPIYPEEALPLMEQEAQQAVANRLFPQPGSDIEKPVNVTPAIIATFANPVGSDNLESLVLDYAEHLHKMSQKDGVEVGGRIFKINGLYYAEMPVEGTSMRVNVPRTGGAGKLVAVLHTHTEEVPPSNLDLLQNYMYGVTDYMIDPDGRIEQYSPPNEYYEGALLGGLEVSEDDNVEALLDRSFAEWLQEHTQRNKNWTKK